MNHRGTIVGSLLLVLVLLLAGCGDATAPTASSATVLPVASAPTLVLWHGWFGEQQQVLNALVDRYNQLHPDSRVLAQPMPLASFSDEWRAQANRGTGPHLALVPSGWLGALAEANLPLALEGLIDQKERDRLLSVTVGSAQVAAADGTHLYGLPVSFDTQVLFYNASNVLTPPADTDELLQQARGLGDPASGRWGLALNISPDTTIGYLYAFDGQLFDENGKVVLGTTGRAGAEQWLGWLAQLNADQGILARLDSGVRIDRDVKNSNVLMTFGWSYQLADYRRVWRDQLGLAPLPKASATGKAPQPYAQSDVLVVNRRATEAERQTALAFLRFMISDDAQITLAQNDIQPARRDLALDGDQPAMVAARVFRAQAEQARPIPNTVQRDAIRSALDVMQRKALSGAASPADAVTEADARLRAAFGQ